MPLSAKLVVLAWIVFGITWVVSALSVKPVKERQPFVGRLLYLWLLVAVAVLLSGAMSHLSRVILPRTRATGTLADILVLGGVTICVWARLVLGGNWSARVTLKEQHELIQRGPYRLVRHPIYSGLLLMILGTATLTGQLSGFLALAVCFFGFWIKLRQEESLLTHRLPGYSEYKARTKALVPYLF